MSHGTSFQYFFLTMSDGLKLDPFALWAIEPTASLPQASHGNAGHVCRGLCRVAAVLWHWHFYRLWLVSAFYIAPIQRGNVTQPEIKSKNRVKWTIPKTNITFLHTSLDVKMFRCQTLSDVAQVALRAAKRTVKHQRCKIQTLRLQYGSNLDIIPTTSYMHSNL